MQVVNFTPQADTLKDQSRVEKIDDYGGGAYSQIAPEEKPPGNKEAKPPGALRTGPVVQFNFNPSVRMHSGEITKFNKQISALNVLAEDIEKLKATAKKLSQAPPQAPADAQALKGSFTRRHKRFEDSFDKALKELDAYAMKKEILGRERNAETNIDRIVKSTIDELERTQAFIRDVQQIISQKTARMLRPLPFGDGMVEETQVQGEGNEEEDAVDSFAESIKETLIAEGDEAVRIQANQDPQLAYDLLRVRWSH